MNNDRIAGKLYLVGAFSLAGTSVVAARYVSNQLGVFTIAAVSMAFALMLLIPISFSKLKALRGTISLRQIIPVMIEAFFGMFLFRFLLLSGVSRTSALEAGILTGATPAITAFLAWAVLRESVGVRALVGILSTILGVLLVQGLAKVGSDISQTHLVGNLLVVGAAASESIFNIVCRTSVLRKAEAGKPLDPIVQTTLVTAAALLFCMIPALFEQPIERLSQLDGVAWLSLLWYGFFVTALAYICWYAGIKRSGAFTAAAFSGLMPLTSMLLSSMLLRELTDLYQWLGGACVIAGMMLIGTRKKRGIQRTVAPENPHDSK
ncbi:MAG: DMT family transporter [Christensenella sp.]|nr:DMT family transporter [Christensenella sp.]